MRKNLQNYGWFAFRVLVGLLFMIHGAQKLFGWFGGNPVELFSLFGLAGIIEFFGGLFVILGLFTTVAAGISSLEMLVAYFMMHASKSLLPTANGGEAALLFFASFLVIFLMGPGKWALDNRIHKKK